jgi:hypothetical protein
MASERTLARLAGSLYLVVAVGGMFAELFVRSSIVEPGNAAATADNIRASATLFRAGFVADLLQATFFLFTAMALYLLLRHVHGLVARAMVVFVAVSVAIMCLNLVNQWAALQVATGEGLAGALGPAGSAALTGLFADLHRSGFLLAQMFFGLWLLPLGYLVLRSGWFPKVLGVLLIVGCCGYLVDLFLQFLAPGIADGIELVVVAPAAIGELSFIAWLLVKGVPVSEPAPRAHALAG